MTEDREIFLSISISLIYFVLFLCKIELGRIRRLMENKNEDKEKE